MDCRSRIFIKTFISRVGKGGLTIGILPDDDRTAASPHIQIPIVTGMGSARGDVIAIIKEIEAPG